MNKKKIKQLASILLALVMVLGLSMTAFADENYKITITNPQVDDVYSAYKIFDVKTDGNDAYSYTIKSTDMWWNDVLIYMGGGTTAATATDEVYSGEGITLTPAAGVANTYTVECGDDFSAAQFAEFLAGKATVEGSSYSVTATSSKVTASDSSVDIALTSGGYYLVTCSGASHTTALAELNTAAPTVKITDKNEGQTVDKKQADAPAEGATPTYGDEALNVQIGDTVYYQITGTVPDRTGYTSYSWKITDTLSEGLTLNQSSIVVKVGNDTITPDSNDTWTLTSSATGFTLEGDLVKGNYTTEAQIEVTYTAIVNDKAITGVYDNKVELSYSNDPNDNTSKGTYTETTEVYDANITVVKYDGDTATESDGNLTAKDETAGISYLSGAKFVLYRMNGQNKEYYKYTAAAETPNTPAAVSWVSDMSSATVLTTDAKGKLSDTTTGLTSFAGLEDGEYYLLETEAPDGYNLLKDPVLVKIDGSGDKNGDGTVKTDTATGKTVRTLTANNNVANKAGTELPSTGGMGTTIFYIIGGILVVAAAVLLITRRRMNASK